MIAGFRTLFELRREYPDHHIKVRRGILQPEDTWVEVTAVLDNTAVIIREPREPKELVRLERVWVHEDDYRLQATKHTKTMESIRKGRQQNLKQKSTLKRSTPLKSKGKVAKRQEPQYEEAKAEARQRARGMCESCKYHKYPLDPHHVFGRNNQIERKTADSPELLAMICRECHEFVTNHPRANETKDLQWRALTMFAAKLGVDLTKYRGDWSPLQAMRDILRNNKSAEEDAA